MLRVCSAVKCNCANSGCVWASGYCPQVTEAGGMTKFIDSGAAKLRIEEAATKKQVRCVFAVSSPK